MILVTLSEENFEYDIHSLVKAFFPEQEVCVTAKAKDFSETPLLSLYIEYQKEDLGENLEFPNKIQLQIQKQEPVSVPVNFKNRSETKNFLKQTLYQMLSQYTGSTLPWGTLTGIRPTKIPMAFLEQGKEEAWIYKHMEEMYFASREKIGLSIQIAKRELKVLKNIDYEQGYSLYIGIPFCPSTCLYCSFTSYPLGKWSNQVDQYLEVLERELEFTAEQFSKKKLNTIYIGGGTPTTLNPLQLERLLCKLEESFDFSNLVEYTVEAGRPDSITKEKLLVLKKHGISRISINPQTMKQETLKLIGRHHTIEETRESFTLARALGFDNINMDLIVGLPEETMEDVRQTMEQIQEMNPDSITVHSLARKRGAKLAMCQEEYKDLQIYNTSEIMDMTQKYALESGLYPYYLYRQKNMAGNFENVGYAREGKEGIYNILIMEEKQTIVACGAGTISKRVYPDGRIERCDNVKDVTLYMEKIQEMMERKKALYTGM